MALTGTIYHLTLVGQHLGNRTQNGFYFTDKSTSLQTDHIESLVKLVNDFNEWVLPDFGLCCSSSWHGLGMIGHVIHGGPPILVEVGYETLTGAQDAESLPAASAGVVALGGLLAGRSHSGRIYVPAIPKVATDGDYLTDSGFGQLTGFANELLGRFGSAGTSLDHLLAVYSRKLGDTRDPGPPVQVTHSMSGITAVTRANARRLICSMRRRRPDHGI